MESSSILGWCDKGEPCLGKVVVDGTCVPFPYFLPTGRLRRKSQRENLLSSKLAAGSRLEGSHE